MRKRLPIIIVYLVLVSFVVTSASFARYTVVDTAGDAAVVAKVIFNYQPTDASYTNTTYNSSTYTISTSTTLLTATDVAAGITIGSLQPGTTLTYHFKINNYNSAADISQVRLKFTMYAAFEPAVKTIPITYTLTQTGFGTSAESTWYYFTPGVQTDYNYTLTATWPQSDDSGLYAGKSQNVKLYISAQQVDASS